MQTPPPMVPPPSARGRRRQPSTTRAPPQPKLPGRIGRPPGSQNKPKDPNAVKPSRQKSGSSSSSKVALPASHGSKSIVVINPGAFELRIGFSDAHTPVMRKMVAALRIPDQFTATRLKTMSTEVSHFDRETDTKVLHPPACKNYLEMLSADTHGSGGIGGHLMSGSSMGGLSTSTSSGQVEESSINKPKQDGKDTMRDDEAEEVEEGKEGEEGEGDAEGLDDIGLKNIDESMLWCTSDMVQVHDDALTDEEINAFGGQTFRDLLMARLVARENIANDVEARLKTRRPGLKSRDRDREKRGIPEHTAIAQLRREMATSTAEPLDSKAEEELRGWAWTDVSNQPHWVTGDKVNRQKIGAHIFPFTSYIISI